jgi:hypothetical protein
VEIADLSADTMATLKRCSTARCDSILLEDDPRTHRNFTATFATFDAAAQLFLNRQIPSRILSGPFNGSRQPEMAACFTSDSPMGFRNRK